uniref:CCHC-type domain-containing protein n=1 Tax=Meloidogyne enterolobii TaxID=390850 RepID=A0A6V7TUG8_MELEN|nr:unnamed protein product [Meloidogyne enterolobii]
MPSSGPIRRAIAPVLRTMRDRIADANGLLDQPVINQATTNGLRVVRTQLESSMERVNELNTRWLEHMDNLEENALQTEEELYDNYPPQPEAEHEVPHEHFMDLHERARGIVELINLTLEGHQGQQLPVQQVNQPNVVQQAVRLPTLELPRFDGEAHRYRTWWNAFSVAVDQQPTLSAFQKHTYLLMCLPANSAARKAIEHYEPSDANYQHVLNILKDRFGDSKRLIDNLYSELMHLPRATDASSSLRNFMDTVDRICYQLESQGQSPDSTQTMLQIRSKLPSGVLRELLMREKESRRPWTHKDLLKQLQEIISLKEEVLHCVHSMDNSPNVKREIKPQPTPLRDTVRTFAAVAQQQRFQQKQHNRGICSLCAKPGHLPSRCRIYSTARDRLRRLMETNRCIRCLKEGHHARDCQNQRTCYRCNGPHHLLACQQAAANQKCQWTSQPKQRCTIDQQRLACQEAAANQKCQWTSQLKQRSAQPRLACQQAAANQKCQWTSQPKQRCTTNQQRLACQEAAANQSCQWTSQQKQRSAQFDQTRLACQEAAVNQNRQCTPEQNKDKSEEPTQSTLSLHTSGPAKKNALLLTRQIMVTSRGRRTKKKVCVLFDPGSMASYITKNLVEELQPPRLGAEQMEVEAFGGSMNDPLKFYSPMYELKLQRSDGTWEKCVLNRVQEITKPFNTVQLNDNKFLHGANIEDAVTISHEAPAIMIGIRHFWKYFTSWKSISSGLYLIDTIFGKMLGGESTFRLNRSNKSVAVISINKCGAERMLTKDNDKWLSFKGNGTQPRKQRRRTTREPEQCETTQRQPGDRALEMEELEELEPTDHQKDQHSKPTKQPTTKTWNLRPRAKQKTTLTVITPWILAIICVLNLLAPVAALVDCAKCLLTCSNKGILVSTPPQITKMEICCEGDCLIRQASPNVTYELPQEMLLQAYTCKSYFWTTTSETCAVHTTCPAIGDCSLIDCLFCIDHVANPTCSPRWAAFLTGLVMSFTICCCGCLLCLLRIFSFNVRALMSICYCIVGCGTLCTRKTTQQAQTLARTTGITARARIMRQQLNQASRNLQQTGQEWRRAHLDRILGRRPAPSNWIPLVVLLTLASQTYSSNTVAVTTKSESCRRGPTGISCVLNYATTLTLLPKGQTTTLLLRNEHGIALGTLSIIVDALTMDCVPKSEGWYRSYTMETLAVKRCPTSGSCKENYCASVRPSTVIPELREVNSLPGISRCEPSSSFWFQGCALPTSACLFYRTFARPTTGNTFELITCPTWEFNIHASLQLEVSGKKPLMESIVLHPGMTFNWNNVSVTPIAVAAPPAPVLNRQFITDGTSVAMVENIPRDLDCATESDARMFNCSISNTVCVDCIFDHDSGAVACSCRDLNFERILHDSTVRLPLSVARLQLRNERGNVYADYGYSPLQLHVQMKHLELLLEFQDSHCIVQVHNLTGCYKCESGAQLQYTCSTDRGNALANIECADGTVFSARCSPNGTIGKENLPFDHFQIRTNCRVDCPAGETNFELIGDLYYVPIKRRFQHGHRDSETLDLPSGNWWDTGFDPRVLATLLTSFSSITSLLLALIIGIGLLYLFVRLNPVFRAWKAAARLVLLITLFSLCFATQAPGGPYGRENMLTSTYVDYGLESRLRIWKNMHVSTTSTSCLESRRTYGKIWHTHLEKLAPPTLLANLTTTNFYQWPRPFLAIKVQLRMPSINHFNNLENLEKLLINMMRLHNNVKTTPARLDRWLDYHYFGWEPLWMGDNKLNSKQE